MQLKHFYCLTAYIINTSSAFEVTGVLQSTR